MFLDGPFVPGIASIFINSKGWRKVTYDDGRIATFRGGLYEKLWYRARCWFHKQNGEDIPA